MNEDVTYSKKLVPIYLMKFFEEKTDEKHGASMAEILDYMEKRDIFVDRRTIYSNITLLDYYGFEIEGRHVNEPCQHRYYYTGRKFSSNELKFLIDAVASSKFLTKTKSEELIKKIKSLGTQFDNEKLNRNIMLGKRIKSMNDKVLKNLDKINEAINTNAKITFQYTKWSWQKKQIFLRNGELYTVSPFAVTLEDDNYYMIAFDSVYNELRHYRVDKMQSVKMIIDERDGMDIFKSFDVAEYTQKTFGMYGGKEELIRIQCHNSLANVVIDRFGSDISIRPDFDHPEHFTVNLDINVSPQFYAWIFGLGTGIRIVYPQSVIDEYTTMLDSVAANYQKTDS